MKKTCFLVAILVGLATVSVEAGAQSVYYDYSIGGTQFIPSTGDEVEDAEPEEPWYRTEGEYFFETVKVRKGQNLCDLAERYYDGNAQNFGILLYDNPWLMEKRKIAFKKDGITIPELYEGDALKVRFPFFGPVYFTEEPRTMPDVAIGAPTGESTDKEGSDTSEVGKESADKGDSDFDSDAIASVAAFTAIDKMSTGELFALFVLVPFFVALLIWYLFRKEAKRKALFNRDPVSSGAPMVEGGIHTPEVAINEMRKSAMMLYNQYQMPEDRIYNLNEVVFEKGAKGRVYNADQLYYRTDLQNPERRHIHDVEAWQGIYSFPDGTRQNVIALQGCGNIVVEGQNMVFIPDTHQPAGLQPENNENQSAVEQEKTEQKNEEKTAATAALENTKEVIAKLEETGGTIEGFETNVGGKTFIKFTKLTINKKEEPKKDEVEGKTAEN